MSQTTCSLNVNHVISTIGTSPGVVAELVYNLCKGKAQYGKNECNSVVPQRVTIIATDHLDVKLSARVARALLYCCLNECSPAQVDIEVVKDCSDVTDHRCFNAVMDIVKRLVNSSTGGVLLDISGGRSSMALAAGIAALQTSEQEVYISTTQVPLNIYRQVGGIYNALKSNVNLDGILTEFENKNYDCKVFQRYNILGQLCGLYTGAANTGILYP